jgi:Cu-Zn family superoxide dismutase
VEFPTVGYAKIIGTTDYPDLVGYVMITELNSTHSKIDYNVSGLMPGLHGLHIHTWGDITGTAGMRLGGHYNPTGTDHGCFPSAARHVGDLFNISANSDGFSNGTHIRDLIHVQGDYSAIGRGIIIHELYDDCQEVNGNAGGRHGMGVIGIGNRDGSESYSPMGVQELKGRMQGTAGNEDVEGTVHMWWNDTDTTNLRIHANFTGLEPEQGFGFHIHEFGDLSLDDGTSAGGHYNPTGEDHGLLSAGDTTAHQGDVGNVFSDVSGNAVFEVEIQLRLNNDAFPSTAEEAFRALVGRGLVLHALEDDGGQPTGNAGSRLCAGVLGLPDTDLYFNYEELFPEYWVEEEDTTDPSSTIPPCDESEPDCNDILDSAFGVAPTVAVVVVAGLAMAANL